MRHRKYFSIKWTGSFLALILLCAWTVVARAERVTIDITQPAFERIPIAIPDFKFQTAGQPQLAREMGETLSSDLDYSGVFRPLDPRGFPEDPQTMGVTAGDIKFNEWRQLGADFLVRATYQVQGSSLRMEARLFDVPGSRMVLGKVYEGDSRNWRAMVHRFADEILYALTGERGVFDSKIAYVQVQGKSKEIYIVDFDGGSPIPVTNNQSINLSPAWSSDGNELAFVSYKEGNAKVYGVNVTSGAQWLISGYKGMNISPAWRPQSRQLAVTLSQEGNPDIFLLSSSGNIIQKLVHSWAINVSPAWSPDGRKLAYVSNETGNPQIYVLDVGSGQKRRLTFSGNYNTSPSWSPKGDWIAYSGMTGGRHNIFIIRPDGGDARQLTHGEGDNESPTWSPDGRMIAFSSTRQGGSAIWVLLTNGTGIKKLTKGGGQEMPRWSPRLGGG
ncbi:Tol-Pal system beta propeller repeat protein TolB [Desulforhabdus amnigena]|jgi:TolB protein|uniref:Protein TolB n=1 Tax=Desulforhabdus amnigena TaxID=40218 RepID=A0A9W6D557_9BACT|nr:Tol-Pal system beta propeller repeat protein TolB [Desulforhabdus amnigena]NLJ28413.1 Tol-Pal system beta propeller repeat protein TolB [Deltaproteobacteria bacterium]GLI33431.1 protein TolB [Desulforhabdus amnigena]